MRFQGVTYDPTAVQRVLPLEQRCDVNYQQNGRYQGAVGFQSSMHSTSAEEQCKVTLPPPPEHLQVPNDNISLKAYKRKNGLRFQ